MTIDQNAKQNFRRALHVLVREYLNYKSHNCTNLNQLFDGLVKIQSHSVSMLKIVPVLKNPASCCNVRPYSFCDFIFRFF